MRELITKCIDSVQAEIVASTSGRGSERSIRAINGHYQRTLDQRHVYTFDVPRDMPSSYDDAPVRLVISGQEISGSVVGIGEFEVTVALDDYLGEYVAEAELVIDLTFILKKLKEMLEGRASMLERHPISRKTMGFDEARVKQSQPAKVDAELFPPQLVALRKSLGSDFLMVWGPPGTGKTHVLARLLREEALSGRTMLLMSNTNIAVDNALAAFLELCETDDRLRGLFEQGKFVRLGTPQREETDKLVLDRVVEKLNADIRKVLNQKRSQLEPLTRALTDAENRVAQLRRLIDLRAKIGQLRQSLDAANSSLSRAALREQQASTELRQARVDLDALGHKRGIGGMLARLVEPGTRRKVAALTKQSADASVTVQRVTNEKSRAEQVWRLADSEYRKLSANAAPPRIVGASGGPTRTIGPRAGC